MFFLKMYQSFKNTNALNADGTFMLHVFCASLISPPLKVQTAGLREAAKTWFVSCWGKVRNVKNVS